MKALATSVAASAILGMVLLSTSPPSCGCSPVVDFIGELMAAGSADLTFDEELTAASVARAANLTYIGQGMKDVKPPEAMRKGDCVRVAGVLECTYVLASGPLQEELLRMRFVGNTRSIVEKVEVTGWRRWAWE